MNVEEFVQLNRLKPADVIISKKIGWNLLDHTIFYLGQDRYTLEHLFSGNMTGGIRVLTESELRELLLDYKPVRIKRFVGNGNQRKQAVKRALSRLGENNYNLIFNNCQHYTSYSQKGKSHSPQSRNFGLGMIALGLIFLAGKND